MTITLHTPEHPSPVIEAMRPWQVEGELLQLHPGDVGWNTWHGNDAAAGTLRVWSVDGEPVAVGMADGDDGLIRMALAPGARDDEAVARAIADDLIDPDRGVLPAGDASVEAHHGDALHRVLEQQGWGLDDPWTQLRLNLDDAVPDPAIRWGFVTAANVSDRTAPHRAAFGSDKFTDERWHAVSTSPAYADARCLVAYADDGSPAAGITVWSAGQGRQGLIEPMGVDPAFRGQGLGVGITRAGARVLRDMGASSMRVCTPSSNTGGVAMYEKSGMTLVAQVRDRCRRA